MTKIVELGADETPSADQPYVLIGAANGGIWIKDPDGVSIRPKPFTEFRDAIIAAIEYAEINDIALVYYRSGLTE